MMQNEAPHRSSLVLGILLVVGGAFFLFSQFFNVTLWQSSWPLFLIVPGLVVFVGGLAMGKEGLPLTIIGSIVTSTGAILLFQTVTSQWASWAYAWALVAPGSVGLGTLLHGLWTHQPNLVDSGKRVGTIGLIIFAVGWVFFEQAIGLNGSANPLLSRFLGPILLIAIGGYVLWDRWRHLPHQ